ncbi:MAG TPA: rhodanese-like domain-containing protein [Myxococcales bacterium]|jgi:rhodanese-related sulfurtransferase|nr:rhodanese-like domain-containing protein [Myxococcales bacterium]
MPREITVEELSRTLEAGRKPLLVDVRQPWEHELSRLPDSLLVPLPELAARAAEIQPAAGQQVVCYCHHGIRSLHAADFLSQAGLRDVVSLAGGIDAWSLQIDPSVPRY